MMIARSMIESEFQPLMVSARSRARLAAFLSQVERVRLGPAVRVFFRKPQRFQQTASDRKPMSSGESELSTCPANCLQWSRW